MEIRTEEVDTDVGPLLLHADDKVITPIIRAHGVWEEKLGTQLRTLLRPGITAVDVGANIGYFALLMAEQVGPSGRVVAIEPEPRNIQLLRLNAERTRGARIEVIEAAAWSESGMLDLGLNADNTGDHRIGLENGDRQTLRVPAVRLDDVLPRKVDLILLDTQATEHVALKGARRLLERAQSTLFVEFWPQGLREAGTDPVSVLDGYRAMGLEVTGAEGELPSDPDRLIEAVEAATIPFTTLRLTPVASLPSFWNRLLPGRKYRRS